MRNWISGIMLAAVTVVIGFPASAQEPEASPSERPAAANQVAGIVVEANGHPVKDALVTLVPIGLLELSGARLHSVMSDADGRYLFPVSHGAPYAITVTAEGYIAGRHDAAAQGKPILLQRSYGGRRLSGRVVDRQSRGQANAEVRLSFGLGATGTTYVVRSDQGGEWAASVPDGDYLVQAVSPGHESVSKMVKRGDGVTDLVVEPRPLPEAPPRAVVDWIKSSAIPINSAEPGSSKLDLAQIGAIVGDARVVGLGEVTHGTRQVFKLKHRLVEYLVSELGFTLFAIEFDLSESIAIDNYVMGRGGEPERLLASQSAAVWQVEELRDLIRWMKDWNQTHERKVRFHGVDVRLAGGAAHGVLTYLGSVDGQALALPAAQALVPLANPATYRSKLRSSPIELKALALQAKEIAKRIDSRRTNYIEKSSLKDWWQAAAQARALAQMLEWRAASGPVDKVGIRERAMAENAIKLLDHYGADARMIFWAHNAHIFGDAHAQPQMSGVHLRRRLADDYRAIGTTLYRGTYQAADDTGRLRQFEVPPAPLGSIEDAIAQANLPIAALNLRRLPATGEVADWFGAFRVMRQFDGLYEDRRPDGWADPAQLVARNYDALLFLAEGTSALPISPGGAQPR